jgi:hypothetical protein
MVYLISCIYDIYIITHTPLREGELLQDPNQEVDFNVAELLQQEDFDCEYNGLKLLPKLKADTADAFKYQAVLRYPYVIFHIPYIAPHMLICSYAHMLLSLLHISYIIYHIYRCVFLRLEPVRQLRRAVLDVTSVAHHSYHRYN